MQAFTRGMQWCCAAGEWDLPYQFDLARWVYIQPRFLVRTLCSSLMQSRMPIYRLSWNGGAEESSEHTCDVSLDRSLAGEMPVLNDQCARVTVSYHASPVERTIYLFDASTTMCPGVTVSYHVSPVDCTIHLLYAFYHNNDSPSIAKFLHQCRRSFSLEREPRSYGVITLTFAHRVKSHEHASR